MCKKVDLLLDKLEREINNPDYNLAELCQVINENKLSDEDMTRIMYILFSNRKWYNLITMIFIVLSFYVILSAVSALVLVGFHIILSSIMPAYISFILTLLTLLITSSQMNNT